MSEYFLSRSLFQKKENGMPLQDIAWKIIEDSCKRKFGTSSTRRLSREAGFSHSTLNLFKNGHRNLSESTVKRLFELLDLTGSEKNIILDCVGNIQKEKFKPSMIEEKEPKKINESAEVQTLLDDNKLVVLKELMHLNTFEKTLESISEKIGLDMATTYDMLCKLEKLGFVVKKTDSLWEHVDDSKHVQIPTPPISLKIIRAFHQANLTEAIGELYSGENEKYKSRYITSITFPADLEKLPMAKELVDKFKKDLSNLMGTSESLDNVFQLNIALIPKTKN